MEYQILHYLFASHGGHVFRLHRLTFGHGATQAVELLVCALCAGHKRACSYAAPSYFPAATQVVGAALCTTAGRFACCWFAPAHP